MIADFVIDKMSSYITGGMKPETAAQFTRGELEAIYKGNHLSRDSAWQWRVTPPPEVLPIGAAVRKADEAIAEILKVCREQAPETTAVNTHNSGARKTGLEGLKRYVEATA